MKISELSDLKKKYEKTVDIASVAKLQEVNLRLSVAETLQSYYKLILANKNNKKDLEKISMCFTKYVETLPKAFVFKAKNEKILSEQKNAFEKFSNNVSEHFKDLLNPGTIESKNFVEVFTKNLTAIVKDYDEFRNTIIKL